MNKQQELTKLTELELSILNDGKIESDDDTRLKDLSNIQEKYSYGWNIWEYDMFEQVKQISVFKSYIIVKYLLEG